MEKQITLKDEVKAFYMENPMATLQDASEKFQVPYETVRDWSKDERWSVERSIKTLVEQYGDGIIEQASGIRLVLFSKIVEDNTIDAQDLAALVKAWISLVGIQEQKPDDQLIDREALDDELLGEE